jgi:hypothetical protein
MRAKIAAAALAVAAGVTFLPLTSASAYCDPQFLQHTGYCNVCLLVADRSGRPMICPL